MAKYTKLEEAADEKREQEIREFERARKDFLFPFYFTFTVFFLVLSLAVEHGTAEVVLFMLGFVSSLRLV